MSIVIGVLVKNEIDILKETFDHITQANLPIAVFDDGSTDGSTELLEEWKNKQTYPIVLHVCSDEQKGFDEKRNFLQQIILDTPDRNYKWILWIDCDERFDSYLLQNVSNIIKDYGKSETVAFRFPRINLPDGKNFPDRQIRLLRLIPEIQWVGELHEVPQYQRNLSILIDFREYDDNKYGRTLVFLERFPILHLKRRERKEVQREWWEIL